MVWGEIRVTTSGKEHKIKNVDKEKLEPIGNVISRLVKKAQTQEPARQYTPTSVAKTGTDYVVSQLERLAALKEKGLLDDEEFKAQKARILAGS